MSIVDRPEIRILPALVEGESLDQPTFHERYAAMPPGIHAELVGGVVSMASPVYRRHARESSILNTLLNLYAWSTPGLEALDDASTILGDGTEVQPDVLLRRLEESGGRSRDVGGRIVGPPELVVEVGDSSRSRDLGPKKADYEAAGVPEYLFVGIDPREAQWFVLRNASYAALVPDPNGVVRSETFPGLWIDFQALFSHDTTQLTATLQRGLASPEHAEFAAKLAGP